MNVKVLTLPAVGALLVDGAALSAGAAVSPNDIGAGKLVFRPPPNAHGAPYARLTFKVSDGTAESAPANTIIIDVTPVNDPATGKPRIRWVNHESEDVQCCGHYWKADISQIADADGMSNATFSYRWIQVNNFNRTVIQDWWNVNDLTSAFSPFEQIAAIEARQYISQVRFTDDDGNVEIVTGDPVRVKRPRVTDIAIVSSRKVRVTFSEAVTVSGYPTIRIIMDNGESAQVQYVGNMTGGSGTTRLMFELRGSDHFGQSYAGRSIRSV